MTHILSAAKVCISHSLPLFPPTSFLQPLSSFLQPLFPPISLHPSPSISIHPLLSPSSPLSILYLSPSSTSCHPLHLSFHPLHSLSLSLQSLPPHKFILFIRVKWAWGPRCATQLLHWGISPSIPLCLPSNTRITLNSLLSLLGMFPSFLYEFLLFFVIIAIFIHPIRDPAKAQNLCKEYGIKYTCTYNYDQFEILLQV
jgi:hypothetical protein